MIHFFMGLHKAIDQEIQREENLTKMVGLQNSGTDESGSDEEKSVLVGKLKYLSVLCPTDLWNKPLEISYRNKDEEV